MQVDFASEAEQRSHYKAVRVRMLQAERRFVPSRKAPPPSRALPESTLIKAAGHQWGPWLAPVPKQPVALPIEHLNEIRLPTVGAIKALIRDRYRMSEADLISHRREEPWARIRIIGMYLCAKYTGQSLMKIGRHFGGRDHSTVLYARDKMRTRRLTDPGLDTALREMEVELER